MPLRSMIPRSVVEKGSSSWSSHAARLGFSAFEDARILGNPPIVSRGVVRCGIGADGAAICFAGVGGAAYPDMDGAE